MYVCKEKTVLKRDKKIQMIIIYKKDGLTFQEIMQKNFNLFIKNAGGKRNNIKFRRNL